MKPKIIFFQKSVLWTLLFATILLFANCSTKKKILAFETAKKKNEITLIIREVKTVEKKKTLDVLWAKYLNDAPSDSIMIDIINQYTLYHLFEIGFENLLIAERGDQMPALTKYSYEIELSNFLVKEFKYKEYIEDTLSGASKTVKLKGIKTSIKTKITPLIDGVFRSELAKNKNIHVEVSESQEGEFGNTVTIKDVIDKNTNGSNKYFYDISELETTIFKTECLELTELIAKTIHEEIFKLYFKELKANK